jgi:hypothetical protein
VGDKAAIRFCRSYEERDQREQHDRYAMHVTSLFASMDER